MSSNQHNLQTFPILSIYLFPAHGLALQTNAFVQWQRLFNTYRTGERASLLLHIANSNYIDMARVQISNNNSEWCAILSQNKLFNAHQSGSTRKRVDVVATSGGCPEPLTYIDRSVVAATTNANEWLDTIAGRKDRTPLPEYHSLSEQLFMNLCLARVALPDTPALSLRHKFKVNCIASTVRSVSRIMIIRNN